MEIGLLELLVIAALPIVLPSSSAVVNTFVGGSA
jgi:hypothetical protein